jgi:hypothetical protein
VSDAKDEREIVGLVAKIINEDELVINVGSDHGVEPDMVFEVLDSRTRDIRDPKSGAMLGSVDRLEAQIRITQVSDKISLARHTWPRRYSALGSVAEALSGPSRGRLSADIWPEGVSAHDLVRFTGTFFTKQ